MTGGFLMYEVQGGVSGDIGVPTTVQSALLLIDKKIYLANRIRNWVVGYTLYNIF